MLAAVLCGQSCGAGALYRFYDKGPTLVLKPTLDPEDNLPSMSLYRRLFDSSLVNEISIEQLIALKLVIADLHRMPSHVHDDGDTACRRLVRDLARVGNGSLSKLKGKLLKGKLLKGKVL